MNSVAFTCHVAEGLRQPLEGISYIAKIQN